MDIEEVAGNRKHVVLMDNNVLASEYGLQQIEKIVSMGVRVDFNQGLDARMATDDVARLLARVKWIKRIRFGCDTPGQITKVERATRLIDTYRYKGEYLLYCILMEFKESFHRVKHWKGVSRRFIPHCQPFRDLNNPRQIIPQWQKDMAHWADRKELYMSCESKDFTPRKGFRCNVYFSLNQIKNISNMDIELIKKRVEKCFSFSHSVNHVEVYEKNSRFYIELDATCFIELKKLGAEFGDDNIVILPGSPGKNTIRLYIDSQDKQFKSDNM